MEFPLRHRQTRPSSRLAGLNYNVGPDLHRQRCKLSAGSLESFTEVSQLACSRYATVQRFSCKHGRARLPLWSRILGGQVDRNSGPFSICFRLLFPPTCTPTLLPLHLQFSPSLQSCIFNRRTLFFAFFFFIFFSRIQINFYEKSARGVNL